MTTATYETSSRTFWRAMDIASLRPRMAPDMMQTLNSAQIDLVVLDIMKCLGEDGLSLCRRLRAKGQIPIIMLTAVGGEVDRIVGLEMGADDYLAKPFNPRECAGCICAVLRRSRLPGFDPAVSAERVF